IMRNIMRSNVRSSQSMTFFLYLSDDHRDLHSFPTRRSSDLLELTGLNWFVPLAKIAGGEPAGFQFQQLVKMIGLPLVAMLIFLRSEEHTSELQSRENLVCRLLLEKKNSTIKKTGDRP